jgi:hypothetical protein
MGQDRNTELCIVCTNFADSAVINTCGMFESVRSFVWWVHWRLQSVPRNWVDDNNQSVMKLSDVQRCDYSFYKFTWSFLPFHQYMFRVRRSAPQPRLVGFSAECLRTNKKREILLRCAVHGVTKSCLYHVMSLISFDVHLGPATVKTIFSTVEIYMAWNRRVRYWEHLINNHVPMLHKVDLAYLCARRAFHSCKIRLLEQEHVSATVLSLRLCLQGRVCTLWKV